MQMTQARHLDYFKRPARRNDQVFNTFNKPVECNRESPWPSGEVGSRRCAKFAQRCSRFRWQLRLA